VTAKTNFQIPATSDPLAPPSGERARERGSFFQYGKQLSATLLFTATIASAQTPAATESKIDFDRDIRPIFEESCLRCHGPIKPKSQFRLDDRVAALRGGADGKDILPGNAAQSGLWQRVTTTNEDDQMPPPGKGDPLTAAQIDKLRDWINQGANWGTNTAAEQVHIDIETELGAIGVHRDTGKFREIEGVNNGASGGLKNFTFADQISPDEKVQIDGHYLSSGQDSGLQLDLTKNNLGYIRAGIEDWRQYYDNFGGFDSKVVPSASFPSGPLALDEGRAWVDFGLTLPRGPEIHLGYEDQFRVGNESALDWGKLGTKNIAPATENIDEHTQILKLDIKDEWAGWQIEDSARIEIHRDATRNDEFSATAPPFETHDQNHDVQGMNTFMVQKALRDWWLVSAGYYYSRLQGSDTLNQSGPPPSFQYWQTPQVTLSTESHIFSASSLFHPLPSLNFGLDLQNEWTHQDGFGEVENTFGALAVPITTPPVLESSDYDEFKSSQNAQLRFTKIPWTVLFADARFEENTTTSYENGTIDGNDNPFIDKTAADNTEYNIRGGFTTSPRSFISLNTQYRFYDSDTSYNHLLDSTPLTGYPAFILGRKIQTQEVETKLVLRPARWIRTTLSYKIENTGFATLTDPVAFGVSPGGPVLAGKYLGHTYGISTALTPLTRLSLAGTLTYSDSRLRTFANNDPSVAPYQGGVYLATASATYAINQTSDLSASYTFSEANYAQNNGTAGVPLGIDYTRHNAALALTKHFKHQITGTIRYAFTTYTEPTAGDLTDYTAQSIFAVLTFQQP
jgi:Planctomycete cytochrome C